MDRCRCDEYSEAVKKLKFYTVGTIRSDILDNFDPKGFAVAWTRRTPGYDDLKFTLPKAKYTGEGTKDSLSQEDRRIAHMWCPYMTPVTK